MRGQHSVKTRAMRDQPSRRIDQPEPGFFRTQPHYRGMKKPQKRHPRTGTTIKFSAEERAWIDARADAARCPMSEVVRRLVQKGIAGERRK